MLAEKIIYDEESRICGTVDLPVIRYQYCDIYDHKSNKTINMTGFKGERMLPPFDHLQNCHLVHYSLQLGCYGKMIENFGQYKVENKIILHCIFNNKCNYKFTLCSIYAAGT